MLPAGLMLRRLTCEAVSGGSWQASGKGAVSIISGLLLLTSEVRGKTTGMDWGIAWVNPTAREG